MIRLVAFLGFGALAALMASWLSTQQGVTVINWLGWRVEVMTSVLVTGLVLGFGGFILTVKLVDNLDWVAVLAGTQLARSPPSAWR